MSDTGRHRDEPDPLDTSGTDADATRAVPITDPAGGSGATAVTGAETVRHEERLVTGTELRDTGSVRVRKHVDTYPVEQTVTRSVEHADEPERVPAVEGDPGEVLTLEDGSLSIPLFEEVLVVTKKLVVRERVVVRKRTVVDEHTLETELRREHVTVEADDPSLVEDRRAETRVADEREDTRSDIPVALDADRAAGTRGPSGTPGSPA